MIQILYKFGKRFVYKETSDMWYQRKDKVWYGTDINIDKYQGKERDIKWTKITERHIIQSLDNIIMS